MANTFNSGGSDTVQSLLIDVRASTQGFAQDISAMRSGFDTTLLPGFTQAGSTLDTALTQALKRGSSGFGDLRTTALKALADIAASASSSLLSGALGLETSSSATSGLSSLIGSILGLPGRATGGPVSPGQAYLVGERGPELFVPTSAGSVAPNGALNAPSRNVNVSIQLSGSSGDAPGAMQRSSRQVASAVRRALSQS
ncbi:tail tape measure protein [Novosphingobium sp. KACC 22771]|uniref:tail tape measure protein n=1 Tax=Novosphingobium sp. KACC 22771 TaxID=3025670 RepID=UPI002367086E|nr:tail tape measure protein [Novosphingobium sp. KACC 22771]WDF72398.1 tail tape measure protein [Novosphingobium sp. KACC 22771]